VDLVARSLSHSAGRSSGPGTKQPIQALPQLFFAQLPLDPKRDVTLGVRLEGGSSGLAMSLSPGLHGRVDRRQELDFIARVFSANL
jgi:hypothetical protein